MRDKTIGDYQYRVTQFEKYLSDVNKKIFRFFFKDDTIFNVPYKHRWSEQYKKSILAKMYQLDEWAKRRKLDIAMVSLTTAQDGLTDNQILDNLKESWDLLRQTISKEHYQYFMLYEPHKSGVPHIHVLLFGKIKETDIKRLEKLWRDKYCMGNDHSFKATIDKKEVINSVVNYLMKYLGKTVKGDKTFTPSELRFHSLFWETGYRMWSSTGYLTFVMGMIRKKSEKICIGLSCIEKELEGEVIKWHEIIKNIENNFLYKYYKKDKSLSETLKRAKSEVFIPEKYAKSVSNIIGTFELRRLKIVQSIFQINPVDEVLNSDFNKDRGYWLHTPDKLEECHSGYKGIWLRTPGKLEKCKHNDSIMGYYVKADDPLVRDVMYS